MYHSSGCGCLTDTFISKANTNFTYLMHYAQCCHGDGSGETCVFKVLRPYTLLKVTYVGISDYLLLSFIVTMAMVVMGDTCVYHGHMQY